MTLPAWRCVSNDMLVFSGRTFKSSGEWSKLTSPLNWTCNGNTIQYGTVCLAAAKSAYEKALKIGHICATERKGTLFVVTQVFICVFFFFHGSLYVSQRFPLEQTRTAWTSWVWLCLPLSLVWLWGSWERRGRSSSSSSTPSTRPPWYWCPGSCGKKGLHVSGLGGIQIKSVWSSMRGFFFFNVV